MIHVFIGTEARYIKTAPLIWVIEQQGAGYRLVDSGQHAELRSGLTGWGPTWW